jgi:hypothetical protein
MTALKSLRLARIQAVKSYEFHKEKSECGDDIYLMNIQKRRMREDLAYINDLTKAISIIQSYKSKL